MEWLWVLFSVAWTMIAAGLARYCWRVSARWAARGSVSDAFGQNITEAERPGLFRVKVLETKAGAILLGFAAVFGCAIALILIWKA